MQLDDVDGIVQVGDIFELYDTYHNTEEMVSMTIIDNEITIS